MSRKRAWKDRRAWIESDAKKRAQAWADKRPSFWQRIVMVFSKKKRAEWGTKAKRYTYALRIYTNRLSHNVHKKTPQELADERKMEKAMRAKRAKEIQAGKRYPVKIDIKNKVVV